jgi:hypothetical protein
VADYLVESLKGLGRQKPGRKKLSERIREALEMSPLSQSREPLENEEPLSQ